LKTALPRPTLPSFNIPDVPNSILAALVSLKTEKGLLGSWIVGLLIDKRLVVDESLMELQASGDAKATKREV
jgi:hypothetical protein